MKTRAVSLVLLVLFSFAPSYGSGAGARDSSQESRISLCAALTRSTSMLSEEDLVESTLDPLINQLILTHVQTYRRNEPKKNQANWRVFDGSWLLLPEFSDLLKQIVDRFSPGADFIEGVEPRFKQWLAQWENVYKAAGIKFAASWHSRDVLVTGRTRFMRHIILRVALKEQERIGFTNGPLLWSTKPDAYAFVDQFHDEIVMAWGNLANMQDAYDVFYRQKKGRYITRPRQLESELLAETARDLRRIQGSNRIRKLWTPWIDAFRRERDRVAAVGDWIDAIRYWQEEYLPLVPLVKQDDTGAASWITAKVVMGKWKEIRPFVRDLNKEMVRHGLPKVGIGIGIGREGGNFTEKHWRQEILVQVCLLQIRLHGHSKPYQGFSVSDEASRNNPYHILSTSDLWTDAGLTRQRLNDIVMMRLTEPPRKDFDEP